MFLPDGRPLNFDNLHAYYSSLGCIVYTRSSLKKLKKTLQSSQQLPPIQLKGRAAQENLLTQAEILGLTDAMLVSISPKDKTVYSLDNLVAAIEVDDEKLNDIAMSLWMQEYREGLRFETEPLGFLIEFQETVSSPIQLAAVLCVLIEKQVPVDDIFSSGLLHNYAIRNFSFLEDVEKAYTLFGQHNFGVQSGTNAQKDLIRKAKRIPIPSQYEGSETQTMHRYFINGSERPDTLDDEYVVTVRNYPFDWDMPLERLNNLVAHFGSTILTRVLHALDTGRYHRLQVSIGILLSTYTHAQMSSLYRIISTKVPARNNVRVKTLVQFSRFIPDEVAWSLLRETEIPPWTLLASRPGMIEYLTAEDVERILAPLSREDNEYVKPFITDDCISLALSIARSENCPTRLKDAIHKDVAVMTVSHPDFRMVDSTINVLQSSSAVQNWVLEQEKALQQTLHDVIQQNLSPFTAESYQNICIVGDIQRERHAILQAISQKKLALPMNKHQQNGAILAALLKRNEQANESDIESLLAIMIPVGPQADDPEDEEDPERQANISRTYALVEALCLTGDGRLEKLLFDDSLRYHNFIDETVPRPKFISVVASIPSHRVEQLQQMLDFIFDEVISDANMLGRSLWHLSDWQQDNLLHLLAPSLNKLINNGHQLRAVLQHLKEAQQKLLLDTLQDHLQNILSAGIHLGAAFHYMCDSQRNRILAFPPAYFGRVIQLGSQLSAALQPLNKAQRDVLLEAHPDLLSISFECIDLKSVLKYLDEDQRTTVITQLAPKMHDILYDAPGYALAISCLGDTHKEQITTILSPHLAHLVSNSARLGLVLQHLNTSQCQQVLSALPKGHLFRLIKNTSHLRKVNEALNEAQCTVLLQALEPKLSKVVKHSYNGKHADLVNAAKARSKRKRYQFKLFPDVNPPKDDATLKEDIQQQRPGRTSRDR